MLSGAETDAPIGAKTRQRRGNELPAMRDSAELIARSHGLAGNPTKQRYINAIDGGAGGIRTHDRGLPYTHFPGVRLRPLGHLSVILLITVGQITKKTLNVKTLLVNFRRFLLLMSVQNLF